MLYVQHLLGIGHQTRSAAIARAMTRAGLQVLYVSGGFPLPHLDLAGAELIQLPPARAARDDFSQIVDQRGVLIDPAWRERRREILLAAFSRFRPQALITELFPFGRRKFRFELIPLIETAQAMRPRPAIMASVRDILVEKKKPERNLEMLALANRYYNSILVHGDPELIPFDSTFPLARRLESRLVYTGYVVQKQAAAPQASRPAEVLVSSGGGVYGEPLLRTAMAVRPLCRLSDKTWRFLVAPDIPQASFNELVADAGPGVVVERNRPDFTSLLQRCLLSISQAGYNTVVEVLAAGVRAVVAPFSEAGESEQTLRARLLQERGLLHVVERSDLTPARLAAAIDAAVEGPVPHHLDLPLDGASRTAAIVAQAAQPAKTAQQK